ncbi:MAG: TraB/GumN family protein [Planctomycetota bacterium]
MNRVDRRPLRSAVSRLLVLWLAVIGALGASGGLRAQVKPTEHPFLWRIEGEVPSYLFGTIHLPDERVTTLHPAVEDALNGCDALYTELPMDLKTTTTALRLSALPRGQKLVDILGPDLLERVQTFFDEHGVPFAAMGRLKPWAIATQIPLIDHLRQMSSGSPLDMMLYKRAAEDGKEVGGLETVEEQTSVFDGLTDAEQATFTREALDSYERHRKLGRDSYEDLIGAYVRGSGERLQKLMDEEEEFGDKQLAEKIEKTLLVDRNRHMADRIAAHIASARGKKFMFAVGAAHGFGEHSVVKLLREKGFVVIRVPATPIEEADARIESAEVQLDAVKRRLEELRQEREKLGAVPLKKAG